MTASQAKWLADVVEFTNFQRWHLYPVNVNLCILDVHYVYKVLARSFDSSSTLEFSYYGSTTTGRKNQLHHPWQ